MNSDQAYIEMEAARVDSSEQYFSARPQIDNNDRRRVFEAGFDRGWKAALQAKSVPDGWIKGVPEKHWAEEWFIAVLDNGDRVVLKALPEEYSYDFTTADATYFKSYRIKKWMQFPDSQYAAPQQADKVRELEKDSKRLDYVLQEQAFIMKSETDTKQTVYQLWAQDEDEYYWSLCGNTFHKTKRAAIDCAMQTPEEARTKMEF